MSDAVRQFVDIVNRVPEQTRRLYCWCCGTETPHTIYVNGNTEYFTCQSIRDGVRCCNVTTYTTK